MTAWLILAGSAVVIVYAGTKLSRYGDDIADLTGLGRLWIGVVLMAAATSLPELFTTVSAAWIDAPDLAAQVVARVKTINFGAKEGVQAVTIVYPIDFLPAS